MKYHSIIILAVLIQIVVSLSSSHDHVNVAYHHKQQALKGVFIGSWAVWSCGRNPHLQEGYGRHHHCRQFPIRSTSLLPETTSGHLTVFKLLEFSQKSHKTNKSSSALRHEINRRRFCRVQGPHNLTLNSRNIWPICGSYWAIICCRQLILFFFLPKKEEMLSSRL